jgi:hypothetical protein
VSKLDGDIRQALTALEGSVPAGYFDGFVDRVAARMEVDAMAGANMSEHEGSSGADAPPGGAPAPTKSGTHENTGLHDIKELASSAKRRISRRVTTQSDVEESLLVSSSSALSAVALPAPDKEAPPPLLEQEVALGAAATPVTAAATPARHGGVAAVAAAAVALFVILGGAGGGDGGDAELAMQHTSEPGGLVPAVAPLEEPAADETATPVALEVIALPLDDEEEAAELDLAHGDDVDPAPESQPERVAAAERPRPAPARDDRAAAPQPAASRPAAEPRPATPRPAADKPAAVPDAEKSIDQLLAEAAGTPGQTRPAEPKEAPAAKSPPAKTSLDRADIQRGMRGVQGRAQACYDKYQVPGTVTVRLTIENDGTVSRADATGSFASTDTGTCVASAVKAAQFAAWDGRPMSLSYPFLLSP